jgi:hypothetical protein
MPRRSTATSVFVARRVQHRNEADPLLRAMDLLGWKEETKATEATIIWDVDTRADMAGPEQQAAQPGQLVNRLPEQRMLHCCRKAIFARLVSRLRALLPPGSALDDGKYIPQQWALPIQADALATVVAEKAAASKRRKAPPPVYIVKPDGGSMGDGIVLTTEPTKPSWHADKERVVQEYIGRPLLLDGLKFDLRLYVLVTSVAPLRAFVCHEGLARFAVDSYVPPSSENMRNVHMHLTNYSLNKKAEGFVSSEKADGGDDGSKRTVSSVFASLVQKGLAPDVDALWAHIHALIGRTLATVRPAFASYGRGGAEGGGGGDAPSGGGSGSGSGGSGSGSGGGFFQVLGFDVLLDSHCRPWLLELNDHPSLRIDLSYDEPGQYSMNGLNSVPSPVDEAIKVPMLTDALRVVAGLRGLKVKSRAGGDAGGFGGTGFYEVPTDGELLGGGFDLIEGITRLFEQHTPPSARREEAVLGASGYARDPDKLPGPRWRGAAAFTSFLQAAGLVARPGGAAAATPLAAAPAPRTLARHEVDLIVLAVCGKGGSMDLVDFAEACVGAARRIWPERKGEHASALLAALVERFR